MQQTHVHSNSTVKNLAPKKQLRNSHGCFNCWVLMWIIQAACCSCHWQTALCCLFLVLLQLEQRCWSNLCWIKTINITAILQNLKQQMYFFVVKVKKYSWEKCYLTETHPLSLPTHPLQIVSETKCNTDVGEFQAFRWLLGFFKSPHPSPLDWYKRQVILQVISLSRQFGHELLEKLPFLQIIHIVFFCFCLELYD